MKNINRRDFVKAMGFGAAGLALPGCSIPLLDEGRRPPNIIFIMVDDMGYADTGCYGSQAIHTPAIDRMAAEGMRFTDAYSGNTVCAPARCTLMTGRHSGHSSVRGNTGGISLRDSDPTVAEVLKRAGYATGGFGKWGLGDIGTAGTPEKQGFDIFFGYYHQIHAHDYYPEYLVRNGEKVMLPGNENKGKAVYSHYVIFEEMKKFIRSNADQPFFCYAPWTPPHGHYVIPEDEPAVARYRDRDWPARAKTVAAMDTMVDRHVGEVFELLEELGITEDTIVFFCSDNGTDNRLEGIHDSSGPLRGRKRDMYEGGLRVPMIARWPGKIAARSESSLPCYFPDLMPTLADLAGMPELVPDGTDGISFAPTLLGSGAQAEHDCLYWEWPLYNWGKKSYPAEGLMQAVRRGRWKMLRHRQSKPWELYDLSRDIGETTDVAAEHPEVVAGLTAWIAANRVDPVEQIEPEMPAGKKYR